MDCASFKSIMFIMFLFLKRCRLQEKINQIFAGLVGLYREIFPSVSKTSLGLQPRVVFETLGNISL